MSTKRQTINEMGLTPPCEPNDADDETCTIVLDSVTVVFDGNLTATTAKYIPFAAFCISGSLSRRCVEGVWVDESIIQEGELTKIPFCESHHSYSRPTAARTGVRTATAAIAMAVPLFLSLSL